MSLFGWVGLCVGERGMPVLVERQGGEGGSYQFVMKVLRREKMPALKLDVVIGFVKEKVLFNP